MDVMDATLTTRHPQHLRLLPMEISIKVLVLALVGGGTDADRSHCLLVGVPVMWNSLQLSAAGCRRKKRRSSNLDQLHLHLTPCRRTRRSVHRKATIHCGPAANAWLSDEAADASKP
ncbi:hypothetical protein GW17_00039328 [Ensete ventricosum]|nr:hypothetical protein GW17_00039328 [Ensete ventricosum]